jgi:hypothetical protein
MVDRVLIFITNHSQDETGDLYIGRNLCAPVNYVCTFISIKSNILTEFSLHSSSLTASSPPRSPSSLLRKYPLSSFCHVEASLEMRETSRLSLPLVVCKCISYFILYYINININILLYSSLNRLGATHLVTFTALEFQPSLTSTMFMDFAQQVLVEGFPLESALPQILSAAATSNMARHSSIVHFLFTPLKLRISEYIWSHDKLRPYGHRLPSVCPECLAPRAYGKPIMGQGDIMFACGNANCNGKLRFQPQANVVACGGPESGGGRWLVKEHQI